MAKCDESKEHRYRISKPLALGGMAQVELAEHLEDGSKVQDQTHSSGFSAKRRNAKSFCGRAKAEPKARFPSCGSDDCGRHRRRRLHDFEWVDGTDLEEVFSNLPETVKKLFL